MPFTKATRAVVDGLVALVVRRVRDDGRANAQAAEETTRAEQAFRKLEAAAEAEFEAVQLAAREELARSETEVTGSHTARIVAAEQKLESELARYSRQTEQLSARAEKEFEEAQWLADAAQEATETKLTKEHEGYRRTVAAAAARLTDTEKRAAQTLEKTGHAPLPGIPDAPPGTDAGDSIEPTSLNRECEELWTQPGQVLERLAAASNSFLTSTASIALGGAAGLCMGGIAAAILVRPIAPQPVAIAAASGAAVALAIVIPIRVALRRRVPAIARHLAESIAAGRLRLEAMSARIEDRRQRLIAAAQKAGREELRGAKKAHDNAAHTVAHRKKVEEPALRARLSASLAAARESLASALTAARSRHEQTVEDASRKRAESLSAANQACVAAVQLTESRSRAEYEKLLAAWTSGTDEFFHTAAQLRDQAAAHCPPWADIDRCGYRPPAEAPPGIVFGSVEFDLGAVSPLPPTDQRFPLSGPAVQRLPLAIDLQSSGSVLVQAPPEGRRAAIDTVENLMLRLLTSLPPGKVRFTIVDPVGLGQNFAGFMHLADHDPLLVGDRIWTDMRHIEQKLTDLTEHMENVIQKYLRNEFPTIQDYNEQAGEVAEPFRFLVIADFPANFSEPAVKRLASIIASGPRCGVYTLIHADIRGRPPAWVPMPDIERASMTLTWKQGQFVWNDESMSRWPLTLESPPDTECATRVLNEVGRAAREAGRVQVPFEMVAPPPDRIWSADSSSELKVPLGRAGATKLQSLVLGRGTAQHVLIAGRTGSGKSTLLHTLITNAALWYPPDQLELYLVDFKKGVEFKTYATHSLPHARVIAVESEREFGLSVLRRLDAELTDRGARFRDAGAQDLAAYRRSTGGGPLPRVLLVVDEFQEFFSQDDRIAQEASLLLDRLVRQGRAFGVHVVLGSQTIGGVYSLARSTIGQMAVRIALQCSEADSYLIMSEDNSAPRLLSRPGEAIYNDASGQIEGNSPFQVVWLSDESRELQLRRIRDRLRESSTSEHHAPIVFEGNVPSDLVRNAALNDLLEGRSPAPALARVWLGEAISIKEPTSVSFRRQATSNLLVVGQQDDAALALSAAMILGLAAGCPRSIAPHAGGLAPILLLDGVAAEDGQPNPLAAISQAIPSVVKRGGVRDVEPFLAALATELDRRIETPGTDWPRVTLIVHGLQRFRDLRKADDGFGFSSSDSAAADAPSRFDRLLREGPPVGLHTIVWTNTATTLERALDRRALREFDGRVLFQMSAADSTFLIDGPQAGSLGAHRAMLFSEESGVLEKFRPYAVPSDEWLAWALGRLAGSHRAPVA